MWGAFNDHFIFDTNISTLRPKTQCSHMKRTLMKLLMGVKITDTCRVKVLRVFVFRCGPRKKNTTRGVNTSHWNWPWLQSTWWWGGRRDRRRDERECKEVFSRCRNKEANRRLTISWWEVRLITPRIRAAHRRTGGHAGAADTQWTKTPGVRATIIQWNSAVQGGEVIWDTFQSPR